MSATTFREGTRRDSEMTEHEGALERLVHWIDIRLGLTYPLLRPVPEYALNPFYWLGALAVVAFVIQGVTGMIMMLYYVPIPAEAYPSTQYIFQSVYYGRFLQTVHLYTAYAMIMLAFMHMMRGYFVSVHKQPREAMWVTGMLMGFVTLGFGFTGYLLPWSVVSKSATDVGIGMVSALPQPVSNFLTFLIVGTGGDAGELLRFFDLHVVVLPAVLLLLLVAKMYMLESHGISEPVTSGVPERRIKPLPIFPDVSMYLLELALLFGVGMLLISALVPVSLPPEYSPQAAASYTPQPDWYFLWVYQILKVSVFEGSIGLSIALSFVTVVLAVLVLLPFLDRGRERSVSRRPVYVTLGAVFTAEVGVLSYWGLLTPGAIIPTEQAVLVLGGTAMLIALCSLAVYRALYSRAKSRLETGPASSIGRGELRAGVSFTALLGLGALSIGGAIDGATNVALTGVSLQAVLGIMPWFASLALAVSGTIYLLYRLDVRTGNIRRRVRLLEIGLDRE